MQFGMMSGVGRGMGVLNAGGDRRRGIKGQYWKFGIPFQTISLNSVFLYATS